MNSFKSSKGGGTGEYVVRYREQLSGGDYLFLMVEGSDRVYIAARPEEAQAEADRRLTGGPAMEIRIDVVTPA